MDVQVWLIILKKKMKQSMPNNKVQMFSQFILILMQIWSTPLNFILFYLGNIYIYVWEISKKRCKGNLKKHSNDVLKKYVKEMTSRIFFKHTFIKNLLDN